MHKIDLSRSVSMYHAGEGGSEERGGRVPKTLKTYSSEMSHGSSLCVLRDERIREL